MLFQESVLNTVFEYFLHCIRLPRDALRIFREYDVTESESEVMTYIYESASAISFHRQ